LSVGFASVSRVQFNQVFFGSMMLSLLSAFVLPPHVTDIGRSPVQTLLIPISRPAYRIANAIRGHVQPQPIEDTRPALEIQQENLALKQQVQWLSTKVEELSQQLNERASLGAREDYCDRFDVTAADTGRDGITIAGTKIGAVREDQPVLSSGVADLIGRVTAIRGMAAHVRLVTDAGFTVTGHFVSYSATNGAEERNLLAIVTGNGLGQMVIDNLHSDEVQSMIKPGDSVVLRDETWPPAVQGIRIGRVATIQPLAKQPLFADIQLVPEGNLTHLNDVWVMTRQP
jgi:rod shape-determining protein MreC